MINRIYLYFCALIILAGCGQSAEFHNHTGFTQGTTFNIVFQGKPFLQADRLRVEIDRRLVEIDNSLSLYNPGSLINAINRNEPVKVDTLFAEVFRLSLRVSEMTDGMFDITVGPLVRAWGFGPEALEAFDSTRVDSLMALVGFRKVSLKDGQIVKENEGIWLDMNAVAQGYSVDVIGELLEEHGIKNYLVEIGGEVRARGVKGERRWRVGVDTPSESGLLPGEDLAAIIELADESLATSGNYRKFFVGENGVKYTHTINPLTGHPAKNRLLSATITAPDAGTADAFATACMASGVEKAVELIEKYDFLEGFLIFSDDTGGYLTWSSDGMRSRMKQE